MSFSSFLVFLLCLLDLSSAFDSVDHDLLQRLRLGFGLTDAVLEWIRTFLSDRTHQIAYNGQLAATQPLLFGVPQGSVLGPLLLHYVLYTAELGHLAYQHGIGFHQYADDSQVYISVPVSDASKQASIFICQMTGYQKSHWLNNAGSP